MMEKKELEKKFRDYRKGLLSEEEVDALWIEFLKDEELYKRWLMEENLYHFYEQQKRERVEKGAVDKEPAMVEGTAMAEVTPMRRIWPLALASAAVVVLALFLQVFRMGGGEVNDVSYLALESISVDFMISGTVYRSGTAVENDPEDDTQDTSKISSIPVGQEIDLAVLMAMRGDHATAKRMLESLLDTPDADNRINRSQRAIIQYNLGIAHYNTGEFEQSITAFQTVQENISSQLDEVTLTEDQVILLHWFQANANLKLNRPLEATAHLTYLSGREGAISRQSTAILDKLLQTESRQETNQVTE
jgi:tetratricopeptide (TPR) repeat protein